MTTPRTDERRAVHWLGGTAVTTGLALLGLMAYFIYDYNTYTGDDPLYGLAIIAAFFVGVPGGIALVLGAGGLALLRRTPGWALGLAIAGTIIGAGPVLLALTLWLN